MDAVFAGEGGDLRLLVRRVQLDLVDGGHDGGLVQQAVQVRHQKVGDTDGAGTAGLLNLLQCLPALDELVVGRGRPVDQIEVDLVEAELLEALLERVEGRLGALAVVPELGGDEQLGAVDARGGQRLAHALFVAVNGGGVDVAVTHRERVGHDAGGFVGFNLEHAETELRNRVAVVEGDGGYRFRHAPTLWATPTRLSSSPQMFTDRESAHSAPVAPRTGIFCARAARVRAK